MFTTSTDISVIEEIIRKNWPSQGTDASLTEDSAWEILNDNNADDALNRHWFKQNYVHQMPQHTSSVMYH